MLQPTNSAVYAALGFRFLGMPWQFMGKPFNAFIDSDRADERAQQEGDQHPTFGFEMQYRHIHQF